MDELRRLWLIFGYNPPNRLMLYYDRIPYIVIDDSTSIYRLLDYTGGISVITNIYCEPKADYYISSTSPKSLGCVSMTERDWFVRKYLYSYVFNR